MPLVAAPRPSLPPSPRRPRRSPTPTGRPHHAARARLAGVGPPRALREQTSRSPLGPSASQGPGVARKEEPRRCRQAPCGRRGSQSSFARPQHEEPLLERGERKGAGSRSETLWEGPGINPNLLLLPSRAVHTELPQAHQPRSVPVMGRGEGKETGSRAETVWGEGWGINPNLLLPCGLVSLRAPSGPASASQVACW